MNALYPRDTTEWRPRFHTQRSLVLVVIVFGNWFERIPVSATTTERVLLKLSGESMASPEQDGGLGIHAGSLERTAQLIRSAIATGAQLAVVPGGGNIVRGGTLAKRGDIGRVTADRMGMLGTMINALAIEDCLRSIGVPAHALSALPAPPALQPFSQDRAEAVLESGAVLILAAGTGHPYFTTDTGSTLRAAELNCSRILKATKVDGVYNADPAKDPSATRYSTLSIDQCIDDRLEVMDLTALTMCRDHRIGLSIFNFREEDSVRRVLEGDTSIATTVTAD